MSLQSHYVQLESLLQLRSTVAFHLGSFLQSLELSLLQYERGELLEDARGSAIRRGKVTAQNTDM